MQRWGSEQAARSSVLLRTASLMSLASLGTAGLVLCGSLAVGGPSGSPSSIALGNGPAAVTGETGERPEVVVAPAGRSAAQPTVRRSSRTAAERPDPMSAPVDRPDAGAGGAVSGTTTSAAMTPVDADRDSVGHPARTRSVVRSSALQPATPAGPLVTDPARALVGDAARPAPTVAQAPVAKPAVVKAPVAKPAVAKPAVATPAAKPGVTKPAAKPAAAKPAVRKPAAKPAAAKAAVKKPAAPPPATPVQGAPPQRGSSGEQHPKAEPPGQAKADEPEGDGEGGGGNGNGNGQGGSGHESKGDAPKDDGGKADKGSGNGAKH